MTTLILYFIAALPGSDTAIAALPGNPDRDVKQVAFAKQQPQETTPPAGSTGRRGGVRGQPMVRDGGPAESTSLIAPPEMHVIPLKHAPGEDIARIINRAMREDLVYPNNRINSLVYVGPPGLAARVTEMVTKLDVPSADLAKLSALHIYRLKHQNPDDMARLLHYATNKLDVLLSTERRTSTLVLSGETENVAKILEGIESLDVPTPAVEIEFSIFFSRPQSASKPENTLETPEHLKAVASELERFGQIGYATSILTTTVEGQDFTVEGGIGQLFRISVRGKAVSCPTDGPVGIEVDSTLIPRTQDNQSGAPFHLQTTVLATRGDYVVVGSAPSGWDSGESAILVLHVKK